MEEMTFEEQMELAIQQSLMEAEPYHHSDTAHSDDVISNGDHMYTKTEERADYNEGYSESYDIGPDGDNEYVSKISQTHIRKRSSSDSSISRSHIKFSDDEFFTSKETPPYVDLSRSSASLESVEAEFSTEENDSDGKTEKLENLERATPTKKWKERLQNVSATVIDNDNLPDETDLMCREEIPNDFDLELEGNAQLEGKSEGTTIELGDFDGLSDSENKEKGLETVDSVKDENRDENDSGTSTGLKCKCRRRDSNSCDDCKRNRSMRRKSYSSARKLFEVGEKTGTDHSRKNGENVDEQTRDCKDGINGVREDGSEKMKLDCGSKSVESHNGEKGQCTLTEEEKSMMEEDGM